MNLQRYPAQEPLSPLGASYAQRVLPLGQGVHGIEIDHGSDPYQTLTVFPADQPSGDVLVFSHGGGWTNGYKEWMYFMAPVLNAQGVTFVSAGYRLAPAHVFPAGLEDCADAVAWVLQHIGEHGGNAERAFVGGHSAGGHYAALLAVTAGWRSARGLPSQALAGCLPVSGVYRFGEGSGLSVRPRFLGTGAPGEAEAAAAPLDRIEAAACPPFLLTIGERDFPHLVAQASEMAAALRAAGVPVHTEVLEGCDHFEASLACGDPQRTWAAQAASWMRHRGR
jgi:arylformamidase